MTNKLSEEFGTGFQIKSITCIWTDLEFLDRVADILDPSYFDGESKQWVVQNIIDYHSEYGEKPTSEFFREEARKVSSDSLRASVVNTLRKVDSERNSTDLEYVKDNFLDFCKRQKVKNTIEESVELLKLGDYERIKNKMDEALSAGMRKDVGHDYIQEAKARMKEAPRDTVPTGWPVLDNEVLDGGLGPGEIGVFMGATGAGKCVGPETEIQIEYEQVGFEVLGETFWCDPWKNLTVTTHSSMDDENDPMKQIRVPASEVSDSEKTKTIQRKLSIRELFESIGVPDEEGAHIEPDYDIRVKGPKGYKQVLSFFRTKETASVEVDFDGFRSLKCSLDHQLYKNEGPQTGKWVRVKNLSPGDEVIVEEERPMKISSISSVGEKEVLYDMSVADVRCYYSNGILSHNSWVLSALGANAMQNGHKVAHYTLELSESQTGLRYDSIFTDYAPTEVQDHSEEVLQELQHIPGNVSIQYWPTKGATTQTIQSHVERMKTVKWKPDLMLIDYADLLRPLGGQSSENSYHQMGNIYEDLRRLSGETGIPIWTVSQTQRQAVREKVVKGDRIADSWKKAMTSDFICSLSRTDTDKLADTARFHVIKSRFGPDGQTYPVLMSTATGNIRIFDPETDKGKELLAKMNKNEEKAKKEKISKEWQKFKFKKENRSDKLSSDDEDSKNTSIEV